MSREPRDCLLSLKRLHAFHLHPNIVLLPLQRLLFIGVTLPFLIHYKLLLLL
jgi:hypothetical protein